MEDEIKHFSHEHPLLLKKSYDYDNDQTCAACLRSLCGHIYYCCDDCRYYLHEECAKLEDEIEHFSHKHRLRLKKSYKFNAKCAACCGDLTGVVYSCNDCGYYLHKECAKLEGEIEHSHHPFQSLKLHGIVDGDSFYCYVCEKLSGGFSYRCTDCSFKVDALCSLKSEIRLLIHDHKLKLQVDDTETATSFFCDFCHTRCYSHRGRSLHCEGDCNFKIDLDCAQMLMTSKYEPIQHVSHEHWLIYDDSIKAWDRKYCAACRKVCGGATYCCKPCYFFLHESCAEYPEEIKLSSLHSDHPLLLSNRKERERCDFCNLICQALTFRCDLCNFKIDYLCAFFRGGKGKDIDHFSHPHSLFRRKKLSRAISIGTGNANCYASREQLSSSSPFYECPDCAFYLHESCSLDLIEHYGHYKHIQNHFHNHPLEIAYYDRNVPGVVCCTLCRKCCFGPTYVCFLCRLFLHESCLELLGTNTICQNSFHKHPLIIAENKVNDSTSSFFMNNDFPSCSACGEPCFEKSFACLKCKFLIHELCLQLPHEIQNFFHPCPLSLQQGATNFTCRACEKSRSQFAYCCNRCHFFLDVGCALMFTRNFEGQNCILSYYHHHPLIHCNKESNDHVVSCDGCNQVISDEIYGCIQCDFYLHRSCAAVPHQIEHPLHPKHTLNLFIDEKLLCTVSILKSLDKKGKVKYLRHKHFSIDDDKENDVCCGVCEKQVCGQSYECIRCKFFVHQDCIEPVEELQHPLQSHDNDSLIGVSRKTLPKKKFTCDACSCKSCFGFSYRCEKCSFKLEAKCASLKPSIKYKDHEHLLTFFEKVYDDPRCKVCKSWCSDVSYVRCVECDFNVHFLCVPLPSTIKHKCHIDPLYLTDYFVEDYSGEYYCDACEKSRDPRESVYHCAGCGNYVAHINCVIDEVLLSLNGKRGDVELRIVDRHNIDEKISERGLTLKEIFNYSNEDEKREFEDAEAAIEDLIGEIMSKADSGNRDSIPEDLVNSDDTFILILKNLEHPIREDILNMTFLKLESEVVEVRDYMVSRNCAPILESLFDKYGDISASSTSNPTTKMRVLNIVGGVAQSMCNTLVKDITANLLFNWWKNLQLAQHVGFNVQFAFDHLYRLAQAQFRMDCEFEANWDLSYSKKEIEDLLTKLEILKNQQKRDIRSIKGKSILEKERLTQDMESRFMPAGMGLL